MYGHLKASNLPSPGLGLTDLLSDFALYMKGLLANLILSGFVETLRRQHVRGRYDVLQLPLFNAPLTDYWI